MSVLGKENVTEIEIEREMSASNQPFYIESEEIVELDRETVTNREDLKDYIHEIHNYLFSNHP